MGLLDEFERGIGRQIEEAQKKGKFDNLPGKGKPLNLNKNPYNDESEALIYKILDDNEFALPWIDKGQQIDRDLAAARHALTLTWELVQANDPVTAWMKEEWSRATQVFRQRITDINKMVRDFNLMIPNLRLERFILDPEAEILKIQTP